METPEFGCYDMSWDVAEEVAISEKGEGSERLSKTSGAAMGFLDYIDDAVLEEEEKRDKPRLSKNSSKEARGSKTTSTSPKNYFKTLSMVRGDSNSSLPSSEDRFVPLEDSKASSASSIRSGSSRVVSLDVSMNDSDADSRSQLRLALDRNRALLEQAEADKTPPVSPKPSSDKTKEALARLTSKEAGNRSSDRLPSRKISPRPLPSVPPSDDTEKNKSSELRKSADDRPILLRKSGDRYLDNKTTSSGASSPTKTLSPKNSPRGSPRSPRISPRVSPRVSPRDSSKSSPRYNRPLPSPPNASSGGSTPISGSGNISGPPLPLRKSVKK